MFVVDAPPDIVKSPLVIVEEAFERNPLVKVARPVCVSVELTVRVPIVASCEKRFVDDAVVENRLVVVAFVMMVFPSVERPVMLSVATCRPLKRVDVALATKFPTFWMEKIEPGVDVPIPKKPFALMVRAETDDVAKVDGLDVAM